MAVRWLEYTIRGTRDVELTGLSNADSHIASGELRTAAIEGSNKTLTSAELDVSEALGAVVHLVADESHVGNIAVSEEVGDLSLGGIEGEVANVSGVRRLVGNGELGAAGLVGFQMSE